MTDDSMVPLPGGGMEAQQDLIELAFAGISSPLTVRAYRGDWARFLAWAETTMEAFLGSGKASAAMSVNRHLDHLRALGRAPATRARARQAICSVVARLYRADVITWNLAGLVQAPRVRHYAEIEGITHEHWSAILDAAQTAAAGLPALEGAEQVPDRRAVRDVAILLLLHDSALRRREVATLRLCDVDRDRRRISVWGKGMEDGLREPVPINGRQLLAIDAWVSLRGDMDGALFTSIRSAAPIDVNGVAYVMRVWCLNAGVDPVGPHQLRHAAITRLARTGVPLVQLQRFARHRSPETTTRYIAQDDGAVRDLTDALGED